MEELVNIIEDIITKEPFRLVLSGPRAKNASVTRIIIEERAEFYQGEIHRNNQAFHENIPKNELFYYIKDALTGDFTQLHAFDGIWEYRVGITKKGKVLENRQKHPLEIPPLFHHNRKKEYLIPEGTLVPPLIDMGVFTKSGKIIPSMWDKYKQINQFIQIVDHGISQLGENALPDKHISVIDFGCGKSYLTFLLYYYLREIKGFTPSILGLDLKEDVINYCNSTAKKYGYHGLSFQLGDIAQYQPEHPVDMVVSLHACDTATDFALHHAIGWNAKMIFSVPCCQQECNGQMETANFSLLTRYGLVKERFSALITDAIRGNLLTACGYHTQLVEFVDWENTPKNTLIRCTKSVIPPEQKALALQEVKQAMQEFHLSPTLYNLLLQDGTLP